MAQKQGEGADRQALSKLLKSGPIEHRLSVTIIESGGGAMNGATPGAPDLHYAGRVFGPAGVVGEDASVQYIEGWIELKVLDASRLPARVLAGKMPIETGLEHYTAQQRTWHVKHANVGGRVHVLLRVTRGDEKWWYLYDGAWAANRLGRDVLFQDLEKYSLLDWRYDPRRWPDYDHMLRALLRKVPPRLSV